MIYTHVSTAEDEASKARVIYKIFSGSGGEPQRRLYDRHETRSMSYAGLKAVYTSNTSAQWHARRRRSEL